MSGRLWLPPSGAKELWCTRFGGTCKRNSGLEALGLKGARWRRAVAWVLGLDRKTLGALSCPLAPVPGPLLWYLCGLRGKKPGPTLTTLGPKGLGCDGMCRTRAGMEPDLWAPCAAPLPLACGCWVVVSAFAGAFVACPLRKEDLESRGKVWQGCRAHGFGPKPLNLWALVAAPHPQKPYRCNTSRYCDCCSGCAPVASSRAVCRLSLNARMASMRSLSS